ncbi:hypothetical protein [Flavobacterium sp. N1994]|uniref:hypothetical protein n=1 Tax=Flavobacterium sp. N1994 TaxID=2986827 RepID=UPI00222226C1|nr:hypothetical protein [Flavobacterium sp. N1994]
MKNLLFSFFATTFLFLNANAQRPNLSNYHCGEGQHAVAYFDFDCLRLHRLSTNCTRRFSICSDGTWTVECVDNSRTSKSKYNALTKTATIVAEVSVDGKSATLHFPIEITKLKEYTAEDFKNFGFDADYSLSKDFFIIKGEYIPTFTNDEILVKVPLK